MAECPEWETSFLADVNQNIGTGLAHLYVCCKGGDGEVGGYGFFYA
jgi:hypothetical protein